MVSALSLSLYIYISLSLAYFFLWQDVKMSDVSLETRPLDSLDTEDGYEEAMSGQTRFNINLLSWLVNEI